MLGASQKMGRTIPNMVGTMTTVIRVMKNIGRTIPNIVGTMKTVTPIMKNIGRTMFEIVRLMFGMRRLMLATTAGLNDREPW